MQIYRYIKPTTNGENKQISPRESQRLRKRKQRFEKAVERGQSEEIERTRIALIKEYEEIMENIPTERSRLDADSLTERRRKEAERKRRQRLRMKQQLSKETDRNENNPT